LNVIGSGVVRKMRNRLHNPVSYAAKIGKKEIALNPLLGEKVQLNFSGNIFCINCGRKTKKSFNQGYCYPCFQSLQQWFTCLIHPEKCRCKDGDCMQSHIVYLANSSGLKVGITRMTQVPTRWIDQGATQALAIMRVRSRLQSGELEMAFKQHVADKTNWREMLKGTASELDMACERDRLLADCEEDITQLTERFGFFAISILKGVDPVSICYPVGSYPEKINSLSFDKEPVVSGILQGIKGQYLILDSGVINLRRFSGYEVEFKA
tara:strand:- start:7580 stop:8377 length:798 start_codon:yes stop_codon:yes gene_type:complete